MKLKRVLLFTNLLLTACNHNIQNVGEEICGYKENVFEQGGKGVIVIFVPYLMEKTKRIAKLK